MTRSSPTKNDDRFQAMFSRSSPSRSRPVDAILGEVDRVRLPVLALPQLIQLLRLHQFHRGQLGLVGDGADVTLTGQARAARAWRSILPLVVCAMAALLAPTIPAGQRAVGSIAAALAGAQASVDARRCRGMRQKARENAPCALVALAGCASLAWLGLGGFPGQRLRKRGASRRFDALVHGHVAQFLRLAPAYGGSLVERAPFALLPRLWGGGELAVYRTVAIPCLLAGAALGVWLVARMRAERRPPIARGARAGDLRGQPADAARAGNRPPRGAARRVAVRRRRAAGRRRTAAVGRALALGLAIANKEWALLAAGPVLLALPRRGAGLPARRSPSPPPRPCSRRCCSSARAASPPRRKPSAAPAAAIFHPWQIWWFLGHHGAARARPRSRRPSSATASGPPGRATISHPLDPARRRRARRWRCGCASAATARRARPRRCCALALLLLLRCLLDTWDTGYYLLPFVFALLAWEVSGADRARAAARRRQHACSPR